MRLISFLLHIESVRVLPNLETELKIYIDNSLTFWVSILQLGKIQIQSSLSWSVLF